MNTQGDKEIDCIETKFERGFANAAGVNPVFSHAAKEQMRAMVEQIMRTDANLAGIRGTAQGTAHKAGFAAEEWHSSTFNLDSILNNDGVRAYTDKYTEFSDAGYKINDTPDIVIMKNGEEVSKIQSKYYKSAKETYKALREVDKEGNIKYHEMDSFIAPSDQAQDVADIARRYKTKEQEKGTRPAVEQAAGMVEAKTTDSLSTDGAQSTPLSKSQAERLAREADPDFKRDVENQYKTSSTQQRVREAAVSAAAMSAIISGVVNTFAYSKQVREGKLAASEAAVKIAAETAAAAADSALKAAAVTGTHSLLARYGSQELMRKMAGRSIGALTRSTAVSVVAVSAVDLIKDIVLFSAGKITLQQLEERSGKGILNTSAATLGGTLGALTGGGLAVGTFVAPAVPVLAGLVGGLICSMAMDFAIENGIEAPYRQLLSNATTLRDAAYLLDEVSQNVFHGQVAFYQYLIEDAAADKQFNQMMSDSADLTIAMQRSIDRI
ncbi:hypothetical protein [Niveispirillum sp. BGYR6]|uniref:hypothetical protein n=1 Tax=Niveispirillum sp. BGYR6 TaxID=2971249 RepID=UPI0022B96657|nr:hypothetical protein [Niveispirillum sp. BGYR6]MDG5497907.1 hypothetical protein [Niveispirillum sp. BGYR6]